MVFGMRERAISGVLTEFIVIVAGATTYQLLIAPVHGEPTMISKLNTACQLSYMLLVIAQPAFGWQLSIGILVAGSAVLCTSVISGLDYVLRWSARAVAAHRA